MLLSKENQADIIEAFKRVFPENANFKTCAPRALIFNTF